MVHQPNGGSLHDSCKKKQRWSFDIQHFRNSLEHVGNHGSANHAHAVPNTIRANIDSRTHKNQQQQTNTSHIDYRSTRHAHDQTKRTRWRKSDRRHDSAPKRTWRHRHSRWRSLLTYSTNAVLIWHPENLCEYLGNHREINRMKYSPETKITLIKNRSRATPHAKILHNQTQCRTSWNHVLTTHVHGNSRTCGSHTAGLVKPTTCTTQRGGDLSVVTLVLRQLCGAPRGPALEPALFMPRTALVA